MDASGPVAVYRDVSSRDDKAGSVVLEGDRVGIFAPVFEIIGELKTPIITTCSSAYILMAVTHCPLTMPMNHHIVQNRIQPRGDPIRLVLWEDNCATISTALEGLHDIRDVILFVPICLDCADMSSVVTDIDRQCAAGRNCC